jgi:membrane-bound serine protease (ClpP class)
MDILLDPNIAYLLLAGGLIFAVLALLSPGTGVLEILALFTLVLAGVSVYNLAFNWWAIAILIIGVVLFILSLSKTKEWYLLAIAIICLVVGSAFVFRGESWWQPAVNPFLATIVAVFSAAFFWVATRKTLEARRAPPAYDLGNLIGAIGEAKSSIHEEGSAQVLGELWSVRSDQPIPDGARVRVIGRDGFILEVEAVKPAHS